VYPAITRIIYFTDYVSVIVTFLHCLRFTKTTCSCFVEACWGMLFLFLFASTLEHRADLLVSLIISTEGRTPWKGDQLVARPLPKHRTTQTQNKRIHTPNIHALFGIRTHDPGFRAGEDSACLRPLGYRDRPGMR
jgi:hypothetical protein